MFDLLMVSVQCQSMFQFICFLRFMSDAAAKRAEDSKSMNDKEASLAENQENLIRDEEGLKNKRVNLMETEKYLGELHAECDFLLKYYDMRKEVFWPLFKLSKCKCSVCGKIEIVSFVSLIVIFARHALTRLVLSAR